MFNALSKILGIIFILVGIDDGRAEPIMLGAGLLVFGAVFLRPSRSKRVSSNKQTIHIIEKRQISKLEVLAALATIVGVVVTSLNFARE